jgi:hypothetical protein
MEEKFITVSLQISRLVLTKGKSLFLGMCKKPSEKLLRWRDAGPGAVLVIFTYTMYVPIPAFPV